MTVLGQRDRCLYAGNLSRLTLSVFSYEDRHHDGENARNHLSNTVSI